jgi:hypothetical protein
VVSKKPLAPTEYPTIVGHKRVTTAQLQDILDWAEQKGVAITEGPVNWGQ